MAKINVESGGTILSTGLLQLSGGAAMSTTLRSVTDQNNTASQLKLATNLTQVAGTLQIALDGGSYIDAQDVSGIDRFNVNRSAGSQQVNVDFSSNPTSGTDAVGALRTYANGVALSEAMTFLRNGNVGVGTTAPAYKLEVQGNGLFRTTTSSTPLVVAHSGSTAVQIENNATGNRLRLSTLTTYASIDTPDTYLTINPNGVKTNIGTSTNLNATLGIKGSGSTSATTSLLVQNSSGTERLRVYDDGTIFMGNTNPGIYTTFGYSGRIGNDTFECPSIIYRYTSGQVNFFGRNNNANGFSFDHLNQQASTVTGISMINLGGTYLTQQSFEFANLRITPTYDFNVNTTTNAIARGIYYNPTITNLRVAQHYAWQNTSGAMIVNSSTPQASAVLQADSTTQGFLPPRMTNAQRAAITTPAIGLMVYCTDAVEGLYVYKSTGWTFVI